MKWWKRFLCRWSGHDSDLARTPPDRNGFRCGRCAKRVRSESRHSLRERAAPKQVMNADVRAERPWRYPDEWGWGDAQEVIEDLVTLDLEPGRLGCHDLVVNAPMSALHPVFAENCDAAVDYVLAHPELYGLKKEQAA